MARIWGKQHEDIVDEIRFGINRIAVLDLKREDISIYLDDIFISMVTGQQQYEIENNIKHITGRLIPDVLVTDSCGNGVAIEVGNVKKDKWGTFPMIHVSFLWGVSGINCETPFSKEVLSWIESIRQTNLECPPELERALILEYEEYQRQTLTGR